MNKTGLAIITCLLMSGCTDHEFGSRTTVAQPDADSNFDDSSADAALLFASTLENARAADKRVLVHLGAPW